MFAFSEILIILLVAIFVLPVKDLIFYSNKSISIIDKFFIKTKDLIKKNLTKYGRK
jgi:hypothetical protein